MDVKLYGRVAWRFKWLLVLAFFLAAFLATLTIKKISFAHGLKLEPRGAQVWSSSSVVLVTQKGFPWGRSTFPILPAPDRKAITPTYADPTRFSSLALLYTQLANGTDFQQLMKSSPGVVVAAPVLPSADASTSQALPLISFDATAQTAAAATTAADAAVATFERYLERKQNAARIPVGQRVSIEPVSVHARARLMSTSKKTVPLLVFVLIMAGGCGLALALENLRPREIAALGPSDKVSAGTTPLVRGSTGVDAQSA